MDTNDDMTLFVALDESLKKEMSPGCVKQDYALAWGASKEKALLDYYLNKSVSPTGIVIGSKEYEDLVRIVNYQPVDLHKFEEAPEFKILPMSTNCSRYFRIKNSVHYGTAVTVVNGVVHKLSIKSESPERIMSVQEIEEYEHIDSE
jgi:hypothetical protein